MLHDVLVQERSYRAFDERVAVTVDDLRYFVDCARFAPFAVNQQWLKYRLTTERAEAETLTSITGWAGLLGRKMPPDGKHPTAFITICHDTSIAEIAPRRYIDTGIAAQTIMLAAVESGFGGCMIGSFKPDEVTAALDLPAHLVPVLLLGLGKPAETCVVCEAKNGDTRYFRDDADVHFVPKRPLDELII